MDTIDPNENPYVAVASRKYRNLRKKMDKILKVEAQVKEGKKLNEEQSVLLSSKSSVERAISDVESIKQQLEEVARQELSTKQTSPSLPSEPQPEIVAEKTDSSTFTQEVELTTNSTQYDHHEHEEHHEVEGHGDEDEAPVIVRESDSGNRPADNPDILREHLYKLLKLFHVCSRYTMLSGGNPLPPDINYFGKCLLGETSIDCFTKTMNQSVRNAELYLDDELGSQYEAIRGMSYSQISDIIDTLASQLPAPVSLRVPSPPPQSPQINFFADGGVGEESTDTGTYQESYSIEFSQTSAPFPIPPSAVIYDQWSEQSVSSSPLSPSTLAANALGGVINSEQNEIVVVEEQGESPETAAEESKENSTKKPRGRGRVKPRGRGRGSGRENIQIEVTTENDGSKVELTEDKKGISWGGQQKKAGGALAAVAGGAQQIAAGATSESEREQSRGSGRARRGGRGGQGRGGRGTGSTQPSDTVEGKTQLMEQPQTEDAFRGRGGRGPPRGRGRGFSRGEGRGKGRGDKPAQVTSST